MFYRHIYHPDRIYKISNTDNYRAMALVTRMHSKYEFSVSSFSNNELRTYLGIFKKMSDKEVILRHGQDVYDKLVCK
jgi:hypothetical protein